MIDKAHFSRPASRFSRYAMLLTMGQVLGTYLVFGCWLEDFEAIMQNFFAGIYTLPPREMVFNDIYCGIIPVLCNLANFAYPYPVNHYLLYAFTIVCFFIINYYALWFHEKAGTSKINLLITIASFTFLIFPQFIMLMQCTRASVLACIAAFFSSGWFFVHNRKSLPAFVIVILLLATATTLRIFTAGITTGLFIILGLIIYRWNFFRNRLGWIWISFFLLQTGLIMGLLHYRAHNKHPGERYVMNYEYAVTSRGDLYPLQGPTNLRDSVRYQLLQNWLVTDTVVLNETFVRNHIRHITITDIFSDRDYLAERFTIALSELAGFAKRYFYTIIAIIGFFVMLPFKHRILSGSWIVIVVGLLILLSIIGSMYDRGFAPFICISVAGSWLIWIQQPKTHGKNAQYLILLLVLFACFFSIIHALEVRKENVRWYQSSLQFSRNALQADSLHPVVMLSADMAMFSNKAFEKFPSRNNDIIMLNAGYVSFYEFLKGPYRERYNLDITNGHSVAEFIRLQREKGVVLVTSHKGLELFQDYLKVFFALDIAKENLPLPPIESPQHTLNFLRIRAIEAKEID